MHYATAKCAPVDTVEDLLYNDLEERKCKLRKFIRWDKKRN